MRLLLDTQAFLWLTSAPTRFSEETRGILADADNFLFLSAASSWEIAIKYATGKLPLPIEPNQYVLSRMLRHSVLGLAIEHRHALRVATLPTLHRDPFDRMLVAQAELEDMPLVTADRHLGEYGIPVVHAG